MHRLRRFLPNDTVGGLDAHETLAGKNDAEDACIEAINEQSFEFSVVPMDQVSQLKFGSRSFSIVSCASLS